MKTIIVEIKDKTAMQILKGLETAALIKLHPSHSKKMLSKSLRGSLTKKKAADLEKQLLTMREGWKTRT